MMKLVTRNDPVSIRLISLGVSKSSPMAVTPTFHLQITINSRHERSYLFRLDSIPLPFHRLFFTVHLSHHCLSGPVRSEQSFNTLSA
jgi:hypothetical protein